MVLSFISFLFLWVSILVSVAYVTLLERSVLGYIQLRKGPNKLGILGILQPFSDGISLFFKEQVSPYRSNYMIYYFAPVFMLSLSFLFWVLYPFLGGVSCLNLSVLFFLCCSGFGVYGVLLSGWASNSKYSFLGGLRALAQSISYEVSMALILVCLVIFVYSFDIMDFMWYQRFVWFILFSFPLFFCWFSSCLAETNRAPFDFAEGESELVSGFNVEYSSGGFAFIFLSEYMNIIFMSVLSSIFFLGGYLLSSLFYFLVLFVVFLFIWVRGTFPRFRYDKLMYLTWSVFLPVSLNYLLFFMGVLVLCTKI
uniref:NADH-ubiquinone oxidoreductase chain 1 n=1 Tax=Aradus compar TaxID=1176475 RepID=A0A172DYV1_9HEMI|nr:NADH dehydrogenase subunit 1 [Aradus compar]AFI54705.1 NADH dehydrogenase subunit 1 [Aradus compar]